MPKQIEVLEWKAQHVDREVAGAPTGYRPADADRARAVVGIQGDCSGDVTPWGTVINGEENVDVGYGDLEPVWSSDQKFTACDSERFDWLRPSGSSIFAVDATMPNTSSSTNRPTCSRRR